MEKNDQLRQPFLDKGTIAFFLLAYGIAWGVIPILSYIAQQSGMESWVDLSRIAEAYAFEGVTLSVPAWGVYLLTRIQDFAFSIAGIVMIWFLDGGEGLRALGRKLIRWRIGWRWYAVAVIPFGLYLVAVTVVGAWGSFQFDAGILRQILIGAESGFLVYLFLRGPMGEELGLRGFAIPRLQTYMTPFKASVVVGIGWAFWHLPILINQGVVNIIIFLLLAFVLSFVFTWLFNRSQQSLLPVLIFHAAQNAEEIWEVMFPALLGQDWELISSLGVLVLGIVAGILLWRDRKIAMV